MSAVTGCVMTAAVSDARSDVSGAPLSGVGRNGPERKAEGQAEGESECEPFHGGFLSFEWFQMAPLREKWTGRILRPVIRDVKRKPGD